MRKILFLISVVWATFGYAETTIQFGSKVKNDENVLFGNAEIVINWDGVWEDPDASGTGASGLAGVHQTNSVSTASMTNLSTYGGEEGLVLTFTNSSGNIFEKENLYLGAIIDGDRTDDIEKGEELAFIFNRDVAFNGFVGNQRGGDTFKFDILVNGVIATNITSAVKLPTGGMMQRMQGTTCGSRLLWLRQPICLHRAR